MEYISQKPSFKGKLLGIWGAVLAILHICFTLLSLYHSHINGDIAYKTASSAVYILLWIMAVFILYFRFAVLVCAYHGYSTKKALPFTVTAIISLLLSQISELIISGYTYTDFAETPASYLLNAVLSFVMDLAIILILMLICSNKKKKLSFVRLTIITCALPLVISMADETIYLVQFLSEINQTYGSMYLSAGETLSVVTAFLRPILNAVLGSLIILGTHKFLLKKSK